MTSRRQFLQKLAFSTSALPFLRWNEITETKVTKPEDAHDDKTLRVAIMGLGSYGNRVAEAMQSCKGRNHGCY